MITKRIYTQDWWDNKRKHYELVTSVIVINELERGDYPGKEEALKMMMPLKLLKIEEQIAEIAQVYIMRRLMPEDVVGDALHLAVASYHKCDFLLTWNCQHLANANKFEHIRQINTMLGLFIPVITTPYELFGWEVE